jgi:hypothetical protein
LVKTVNNMKNYNYIFSILTTFVGLFILGCAYDNNRTENVSNNETLVAQTQNVEGPKVTRDIDLYY